jgi:peptide/nickel transport system substrate-binding protein
MIRKNSLRRKTTGALAIVLTTLAIALSGCSSDKTAGDDSSKITIGIPQDIDGLDPHYATGAGTKEVLFNLFEGLVKPDENGNLNPAVASEYTISEDTRFTPLP